MNIAPKTLVRYRRKQIFNEAYNKLKSIWHLILHYVLREWCASLRNPLWLKSSQGPSFSATTFRISISWFKCTKDVCLLLAVNHLKVNPPIQVLWNTRSQCQQSINRINDVPHCSRKENHSSYIHSYKIT